jgi:hypothetical protein
MKKSSAKQVTRGTKLRFGTRPVPPPKPNPVLVQTLMAGGWSYQEAVKETGGRHAANR